MARAGARLYVVTAPARVRGIYDSWVACAEAVKGVSGARYQAVASRAQAEAMLRGEGTALEPGLYAFVDGNHLGGVGVVIVERKDDDEPEVIEALGLSVSEVFAGGKISALTSRRQITDALKRLRNVLAELAALHLALRLVPEGATVTVVHDYEGVGAWLEGRWKAKDPLVAELVTASRRLIDRRRLAVGFRRQAGHAAAWAGRDDFAYYNAMADRLAAEAGAEA